MWWNSSSARRKTGYVRISRPRLARSSRPRPLQDEQIVLEALRERKKRGAASGRRSLAVATGLSEDRVKKALAILRESGSVEIWRGRAGIVLLH